MSVRTSDVTVSTNAWGGEDRHVIIDGVQQPRWARWIDDGGDRVFYTFDRNACVSTVRVSAGFGAFERLCGAVLNATIDEVTR